jgi:hypothetical protein
VANNAFGFKDLAVRKTPENLFFLATDAHGWTRMENQNQKTFWVVRQ